MTSYVMLGEEQCVFRRVSMKLSFAQTYKVAFLFGILLVVLSACGGTSSNNAKSKTSAGTSGNASSGGGNAAIATTPQVQAGPRPCPALVSDPSYWNPIVITQRGVNAVTSVVCGNLTGSNTIQAVVTSQFEGTGQVADIYVFDNITSPSPARLFFLQGLYKGSAKISTYGTLMTAEADQGSSVNQNAANGNYQQDLFREFAWSDGAGTFVPVSFPGIFPDLTRYQAESDQQQIGQASNAWKLNAADVASKLASQLLNWTNIASSTITSGGGQHDSNAVVTVKNTSGGSIQVTLGRLEGNTNTGIWEATAVTTPNLTITTPQNRDLLHSPFTIIGTGNAAGGKVGTITVLDHLYNNITKGTVNATGASASGNTSFSTSVSYSVSFKTGTQEGLVILDTGSGAIILKELLD